MADIDKRFDDIMDRAAKSFDRIMGRIQTPSRPGATVTSREEMLAQFGPIALDKDGLTLKRMELDRAHGPAEGAKQFVEWYRDMQSG